MAYHGEEEVPRAVELVPVSLLGEVGHPLPQLLQRHLGFSAAAALSRRLRLDPAAVHVCRLTGLALGVKRNGEEREHCAGQVRKEELL